MKKTSVLYLLLSLSTVYQLPIHGHHHTYIVEEPVAYVVVQPPAVVVQPATVVVQPQSPSINYVVTETAPPAEIEEDMGVSPGPNYFYVRGHQDWDGYRWHHVHGHWAVRPNPSAVWVSGCWSESSHHHWRWSEGYWR